MGWPLTLTRTASFSRTIHALPDTVLKLIHDPNVLFSLNPLIINISVDPANPSLYTVTDRLVILGCFQTQTTYICTLLLREDGIDTEVVAGGGTRLKSFYRVKAGENGTTEFTEQTMIEVCLLSPPIEPVQLQLVGCFLPHTLRYQNNVQSSCYCCRKLGSQGGALFQSVLQLPCFLRICLTDFHISLDK